MIDGKKVCFILEKGCDLCTGHFNPRLLWEHTQMTKNETYRVVAKSRILDWGGRIPLIKVRVGPQTKAEVHWGLKKNSMTKTWLQRFWTKGRKNSRCLPPPTYKTTAWLSKHRTGQIWGSWVVTKTKVYLFIRAFGWKGHLPRGHTRWGVMVFSVLRVD